MTPEVVDELTRKAEWRARLISDIIGRRFDDATLEAMLEAGLHQAHSEGLEDAASVCDGVAAAPGISPERLRVVAVMARSIRQLDRMNRQGR